MTRTVLGLVSLAALGACAWLLWPHTLHGTAWLVLGFVAVAAAAVAACALRPRPLFWALGAGSLVAAVATGLEGSLEPDWIRGLAVTACLLVFSEAQHLMVRSHAWQASTKEPIGLRTILPVASSIVSSCILVLAGIVAFLAGWSLILARGAPPVVADSTDAWSGWVLATIGAAAIVVLWAVPVVWRMPLALIRMVFGRRRPDAGASAVGASVPTKGPSERAVD